MIYEAVNDLDHALNSYTLSLALSTNYNEEIRLTSLVSMSILFLQGNNIAKALSLLNEEKEMLSAQKESVQHHKY